MITTLLVFICLACFHTSCVALEKAFEEDKPIKGLVQFLWGLMFVWGLVYTVVLAVRANTTGVIPGAFPW